MRKITEAGKRLWLTSLCLLMFGFVSGQITVTGVVTDISDMGGGLPIPGANVVLKGTTTGTATDFDGNYTITVPNGDAVLEFSFVGLETQEMKVGVRTRIDVALNVKSIRTGEVVVMGYMVQKREDATSAISSVSGSDVNQKPTLGVDKALQGKAAGVRVTSNSGSPGSGMQVQIRGISSIGGQSKPLYVVDGIPRGYDIANINPGDVESINILKDASATALYGARGAAGVIVITTKGGTGFSRKSCEENFSLSVDASYGWQKAWRLPKYATGPEFVEILNREAVANGSDPIIPESYMQNVQSTDWVNEIFRTAPMSRVQVSLDGSSEKSSYAISGSMFKQDGVVKGSDYERFTARFKGSHRLHERVTLGENVGFNKSKETRINQGDIWTGVLPNAVVYDPTVPVYDTAGNWSAFRQYMLPKTQGDSVIYEATAYQKSFKNPVAIVETTEDVYDKFGFGGDLWMNLNLAKNLNFRSTVNAGIWQEEQRTFEPEFSVSQSHFNGQSQLTHRNQQGSSYTWSNILTYSLDILSKDSSRVNHGFNAMLGHEVLYERQETFRARSFGMTSDPDMRYLLAGKDGELAIENWHAPNENSMLSVMGRVEYSLVNKYLLNATVRRDGSSRFGQDNRWGNFPAFGFGWKVHEENFIKNNESLKFLSEFRLRGGWGRIGNANIANYMYTSNITPDLMSRYNLGGQIVDGSVILTPGTENIKWEETETINFGADLSFWQNKLYASAEVYRRMTYDMLVREPQPAIVGVKNDNNSPYSNAGEMKNLGAEFTLRYRARERAFKYEFGGNISFNRNEVTNLGNEQIATKVIYGGLIDMPKWDVSRTQVGHGVAEFYGYKTDGIYQSWEEVNAGVDRQARPGSVRFVDLNGDGRITSEDMTFIGNPQAKFNYGLDFSAEYKGFDLSLSFVGVQGNKIFNAMKYLTHGGGGEFSNKSTDRLDVWTAENPVSETNREADYLFGPSDLYIEDGSYLRLKTVMLGYNLPSKIAESIKMERARVFASVENALTFTKYSGFDPEIGSNELTDYAGPELGIDRGVYPQSRIFTVGINLAF
jgi:TonB-dependent starch-binding outer membrane protein SusC